MEYNICEECGAEEDGLEYDGLCTSCSGFNDHCDDADGDCDDNV